MTEKISRRKLLTIAGITGISLSNATDALAKDAFLDMPDKMPDGVFNVKNYGAVGNGVKDDTVAIQQAIDAAQEAGGGLVVFPSSKGAYLLGNIAINKPVSLQGVGMGVQIKAKPDVTHLFSINSGMVKIRGLGIEMDGTGKEVAAFYLHSDKQSLTHIYLSDLVVSNAFTVLKDANGDGIIVHLHVSNLACRVNRGVSVLLRDAFAYIYFTNVNVDNVPVAMMKRQVDFPGIRVENAQGLHFEKCDVTGGNGYEFAHGFFLKNCEAVHFNTCMADYAGGVGFHFENVFYLYLEAVVSSLCSRGGIFLKDCHYVNGSNITAAGRSKMPDKPGDKNGIYAINCAHMTFSVISTRFNTGNGILLESCRHTLWQTVDLYDNDSWGLAERRSLKFNSIANLLSACTFSENKKGNYLLGTTGTHIGLAVLQDGRFQSGQSGPAEF